MLRTTLLAALLLVASASAERSDAPAVPALPITRAAADGPARTTAPGCLSGLDLRSRPAQPGMEGGPVATVGSAELAPVAAAIAAADGAHLKPAAGFRAAPASAPDPSSAGGSAVASPAPVAADLADDLGSRSRRLPEWTHPLPVARPEDAVLRIALARERRPGQVVPDEAALPTSVIGQLLMVGFEGTDADDPGPRRLAAHITAGRVGGVLFFRRNIASEDAVRRLTRAFQEAGAASPTGQPVLIAVDQEGGQVQRLDARVGFTETPSAAEIATTSEGAAEATYATLATNLAAWGFNLNLGPVVDLGFNTANPVITRAGRAFAADPATVATYAKVFVRAHRAAGVLTALKHFPGHGSSNGDTHQGFVDVTNTFRPEEIVPFERMIADGVADMVMVAHVENGGLDPVPRPASLSPVIIEDILRDRCGFSGVVISDDMEMGAIAKLGAPRDVARDALRAGNDILVYGSGQSRTGDLVAELHARIRVASADPDVARRVTESNARIIKLKATLRR